jgi:hypothetical protein
MSGAPVPTRIIVQPFGAAAADPAYITLPIPETSQVGILAGAASFADGFPPATMSDPETEGGVPPFGQDMNGVLYTATAYLALIQAGQRVNWNADAVAAFAGYAIGAEVDSVTTPGRVWVNYLDGNVNDPDVDDTGWASNDPMYATLAPAAGVYNNVVLPGASDFAIDVDTTAGNVDYGGFVAQRNGQRIILSNTGGNLLQVLALAAGSTVDNRIRNATDLALVQNQSLTIQYFTGLDLWLLV